MGVKLKDGEPVGYFMDKPYYESCEPGAFDGLAKACVEVSDARWGDKPEDHGAAPGYPTIVSQAPGYPATLDELLGYAKDFHTTCCNTMYEKNRRYATHADPFSNFYMGGEYGIAIRMTDKVSRLMTLLNPANTIDSADESIEDTCQDLANYAMLLSALRQHNRGK